MIISRLVLLAVLFYALLLAGLGSMRSELLALALPLCVYWLASLWLAPNRLKLSARRTLNVTHLTAGGTVDVQLELENQGSAIDQLWLRDTLPPGLEVIAGQPGCLVTLRPGEKLNLAYTVRMERGVYAYDRVDVHVSDDFGLATSVLRLPAEGTISVLPQAVRLRGIPLRPYYTMGYHGAIPARRGGAGVAFYGVRDYQPGDALRQVNWRLGARHPDVLYSNEFQVDAAADVGLLLDARRESYMSFGSDSLFEYAVQAAASLALSILGEGNRVGLLAFGHILSWTLPGYGKLQAERIFQALASLHLGNMQNEIPEPLVAHFFRPGSQVVAISPLTRWDVMALLRLHARRYNVLVVSPDPASFEFDHLAPGAPRELALRIARLERQQLIRPLRRAGILTLDWDVAQPLDQAVSVLQRNVASTSPLSGGLL
jgi:uncharacterized protein (DUF58 family)